MIPLSRDDLSRLLISANVKPRLVRDLKFTPEQINNWECRDFLAVFDKPRHRGVLIFGEYITSFDITPRKPNAGGRVEAIICDFCATWQRGTHSASVTFKKGDNATVSHFVCADLDCSLHVRNLTVASKMSRTQLREDISLEGRVARLHARLGVILGSLR